MIRELRGEAELRAACGDDDLVMWTAQGLTGGARAWALGDAVVAAARQVSRHDRMAVWGDASCAVDLVRHARQELGPRFRPFGERGLMQEVTAKLDGDVLSSGTFSWMSLPAGALAAAPDDGVGWLEGAEAEVAALLAADAPDSYARPGEPGVRRWAGLRDGEVLVAVAADAWPAPTVGLLAGVATRATHRGLGLAERVCRWVSAELVAAYGRASLMVDDANAAALTVYERIGYRRLPVMAAGLA
ncbi:FR47-like protein [Nonomuraea maritima]|uniref:FR47-like protein n=1 Tax=Nonomuraea maritima TaxID=683260 RepID=A0A1G9EMW7_9ACTN|nr:GNAT family N-acetyltransferase [Nonomuraea maritima]SDK77355.1 FR47-like protein [Nonomuraea maritima]